MLANAPVRNVATWAGLLLVVGGLAVLGGGASVHVMLSDPWSWEQWDREMEEALIDLVASATRSIDASLYGFSSERLWQAIADACERGLAVRMVVEPREDNLLPPPCVAWKCADNARSMHHKFMIVDGETVWVSSSNWSASLFRDANDALIVTDALLASLFAAEFDEMFVHGRFGPAKRSAGGCTTVSGTEVCVLFGPVDSPREKILELIESAETSLHVVMYAFTDPVLQESLLTAASSVPTAVVLDSWNEDRCTISAAQPLIDTEVASVSALPGLAHHKLMVVDGQSVITGSANWSRSGMEWNDETVLVIRDPGIAETYARHIEELWDDSVTYASCPVTPPRLHARVLDVAQDGIVVRWRPKAPSVVAAYELKRICESGEEYAWTLPGNSRHFVDREADADVAYTYRLRALTSMGWSEWSNPYTARTAEEIPLLSAAEAEASLEEFEGTVVTVRFTVALVGEDRASGHRFLNASAERFRDHFTAFIPGCARPAFEHVDLEALRGTEIEVTGELITYRRTAEIVVTGPWQIVVAP